ncbi:MAG: LPS export ABC transporter periplasmic protein LptC [Candidatus Aceula meridiana]|nr:LPS export ABC transporter periplasmic protein LptC [Candidatus Aceula meridiana]
MRKKIISLACIVVIGLAFSFSSFAQNEEEDLSGQSFEGFDLVGYGEDGDKTWDLKGETAKVEGSQINITNVDANSYGQEDMNVTAKTGKVNKDSGQMRLEGDVVMTTETGAQMLTDAIDWDKEKDVVSTEEEVTILRENMKAVGQGAFAQPGLKTAQLNKDVTVEYDRSSDKDPLAGVLTVTCDGPMEIDYEKQTAVFNENVIAVDEDRKLMADKMLLFFDQKTSKIDQVVCIGNVLIVQGENASYSDKAVYKAQEKKIILSGRPKLLMYMDQNKDNNVSFGN